MNVDVLANTLGYAMIVVNSWLEDLNSLKNEGLSPGQEKLYHKLSLFKESLQAMTTNPLTIASELHAYVLIQSLISKLNKFACDYAMNVVAFRSPKHLLKKPKIESHKPRTIYFIVSVDKPKEPETPPIQTLNHHQMCPYCGERHPIRPCFPW